MINTVIKLSRPQTIKESRVEAISSLNKYNFHRGEMVMATYYTNPTNINTIFAVGIGDGIGKYKIVSLLQNRIVKGVLYNRPRDTTGYLWTGGDGWYLENDPLSLYPGIIINDISSQTLYVVSEDDFIPKQINDAYSREELLNQIESIISEVAQADWTIEDPDVLSYIRNKPSDLSRFTEDILYRIKGVSTEEGNIIYTLEKTVGNSDPISIGDPILVPFDSFLESGSIGVVTNEDKQPGGRFFEEDEYFVGDRYLDFIIRVNSEYTTHIYILMRSVGGELFAGNLINIENNQISLRILEQNGLHFDEERRLTINPATESTLGSMTPEMKQKLDSIKEEDYVLISDIVNGNIEPRVSKRSMNIDPPPSDYRIDETVGFYSRPSGGDNSVETGLAEVLQIRGGDIVYDDQDNPFYYSPKLISIGNNSWKPSSVVHNSRIDNNGVIFTDSNYSIAYLSCFSVPYSIINTGDIVVGFSTSYSTTEVSLLEIDEHSHYIPPKEGYLYISLETSNLNELCVRISGDGIMDGVYEEYTESVINLNNWGELPSFITNNLLYLKKGETELYDSLTNVEDRLLCIKQWGVIELQSIEWDESIQVEEVLINNVLITRYYYEFNFPSSDGLDAVKPGTEFIIVEEKTIDNLWKKSNITIRAKENSSGFKYYVSNSSEDIANHIRIHYELNHPFIINTNISSIYPIYKYGTEIFGLNVDKSLPSLISIRYKPDLMNNLIRINSELLKKVDVNSVDDQISGSSKNLVQNKVVKKYIDRLVNSYSAGDVGDLSKETPFGEPQLMNTANCYILTKYLTSDNGNFRFPLVYGNAIKNGENNIGAYTSENIVNHLGNIITSPYIEENNGFTITSCGILWKDINSSVSNPIIVTQGGHKYISFSASTGEGNSVIYIKDENNNIIWTWHIWEENPITANIPLTRILSPVSIWNNIPEGGPTGGTEYKIMPVYLGFTGDGTNGIYYQWGRKDPFSTSAFTPTISYTKTSTANSIQNPQTLYLTGESWNITNIFNYWDYNGPAPNTFGDYNTKKTIYDPCPVGWKVPNSNIFRGFTTTSGSSDISTCWNIKGNYRPGDILPGKSGYDFKHNYDDNQLSLSYPLFQAIGALDGNGGQENINLGCYWSSVQGCSLEFNSTIINPMKTSRNLSLGFPIHPIIE